MKTVQMLGKPLKVYNRSLAVFCHLKNVLFIIKKLSKLIRCVNNSILPT